MKHRILVALVALNMVLAIVLVARYSRDNNATAQVRRPAEYVMIPGEVTGGSSAVVYLVDETDGLLGAVTYDSGTSQLNMMPPIDLSRVFESGPNVGARQGNQGYPPGNVVPRGPMRRP